MTQKKYRRHLRVADEVEIFTDEGVYLLMLKKEKWTLKHIAILEGFLKTSTGVLIGWLTSWRSAVMTEIINCLLLPYQQLLPFVTECFQFQLELYQLATEYHLFIPPTDYQEHVLVQLFDLVCQTYQQFDLVCQTYQLCNCKKSKCLKLYCECFAAGVYCMEPCACMDCFNKPVHVETVLATRRQIKSRNPLAFAPKVIRSSDPMIKTGTDSSNAPASARHKRGCNCKKSGCLKKYCECYQGGVGCSVNCRCEGCKNAFGRKDGVEAEYEDETDTTEKSVLEKDFQETALHNEQNMEFAPLATPLLTGRLPVKHLFSNKKQRDVPLPPSVPHRVYMSQDSFNLHQNLINIWKQLKKMKSPSFSEKGLQSVTSNHLLRIVKEFRCLVMPGHLPV
ncbi:uncharacterized protein [Primulina eburnea]|uniref:uncharacterized protein n=1 Tax=Primulina eburnea TaxID=1245227 RepID=UPI003C6BEA0F